MNSVKKTCLFMIVIVLLLTLITGCNKPEEKAIETQQNTETSQPLEETIPEETPGIDIEEAVNREAYSIVIYNPISQFSLSTSSEGYEGLTDMLNIKTNEVINENSKQKIVDNLFFIGTAYSMDLSKDFKVGDTITFTADTTQEPDTKCSIKSKNVTITVNSGNADSISMSILKRYARLCRKPVMLSTIDFYKEIYL